MECLCEVDILKIECNGKVIAKNGRDMHILVDTSHVGVLLVQLEVKVRSYDR